MKEFIELVGRMRAAQKSYFQTRDRELLIASRRLEAEVDKTLASLPTLNPDDDRPPWDEHQEEQRKKERKK